MTQEKILGDYKVLKQIGQGSLGAVYLAEHRFTKKPFVLKILPEEFASDKGFLTRFEEEVAKLALLDHPHIVKMHNVCFADGQFFLVTDCIVDAIGETTNLSQYMAGRKERLREDELHTILKQIASALDYAHTRAEPVLHRTLKLNNVLIGKGKAGIHVALSDFGLAKILGAGTLTARCFKAATEYLIDSSKLTKVGTSFLQNFAFLAPEQKKMESDEVASDVYAFGVLAYYLISGTYPEGVFEMPSVVAPEYRYNWDLLVRSTLAQRPEKRKTALVTLLEEITGPKNEGLAESVAALIATPQPVTAGSVQEKREPMLKEYHPEKREARNSEPIKTEMVIVAGGSFQRGSNEGARDEMPKHQIILDSFALDIHPVTNEQFIRFLEYIGGEKDEHHDLIRLKDSRINRSAGKLSIETGYSKHPVVGVTWYGALAYATWVGKRLPTEAEWEVACLGGSVGPYSTGLSIEKTQANFFSSDTTPVMSYAPNRLGIYDLSGNVYEWCQDWYGYTYYEASALEPKNPKGPVQGVYRVLRGGCWKSLKEDLRAAHRHRNNPGAMNGTTGFRCASDV